MGPTVFGGAVSKYRVSYRMGTTVIGGAVSKYRVSYRKGTTVIGGAVSKYKYIINCCCCRSTCYSIWIVRCLNVEFNVNFVWVCKPAFGYFNNTMLSLGTFFILWVESTDSENHSMVT